MIFLKGLLLNPSKKPVTDLTSCRAYKFLQTKVVPVFSPWPVHIGIYKKTDVKSRRTVPLKETTAR